ncbi:MAG TPA: nucleoside triphosphate pyrophosphohydrolase [Edaphocola sp.]|nr:nucleoside triphosphate pyrophosphohydrolase [Edaphocola sp.]
MKYNQSLERLIAVMDELREQCPWDKKQTIHTLRLQSIEELYELADAIDNEDWNGIREELGDLLLHIVFYARIAKEENAFCFGDIIEGICNKLVRRHPHIYSNIDVKNEEEVKKNWEQLKLKEGKKSVLSGVPLSLPAVVKATRLQEKAKQVGFEWKDRSGALEKIKEELEELEVEVKNKNQEQIKAEFGDLMFSMINYARFLNIDAEAALEQTNRKFKNRFEQMEALAVQRNLVFNQLSLEEQDHLWNEVKIKGEKA